MVAHGIDHFGLVPVQTSVFKNTCWMYNYNDHHQIWREKLLFLQSIYLLPNEKTKKKNQKTMDNYYKCYLSGVNPSNFLFSFFFFMKCSFIIGKKKLWRVTWNSEHRTEPNRKKLKLIFIRWFRIVVVGLCSNSTHLEKILFFVVGTRFG